MNRSNPSRPVSPARRMVGLAALVLLAIGPVACGGGNEKPAATGAASQAEGSEAKPAMPEHGAAAKAEQQAELLQGSLPKGFPSDIPVYPGATAQNALSLPGTSFVTFSSSTSADDVLAYYRRALQEKGWSVRDGQAGGLEASKDQRHVLVKADATDEGSDIAMSITGG